MLKEGIRRSPADGCRGRILGRRPESPIPVEGVVQRLRYHVKCVPRWHSHACLVRGLSHPRPAAVTAPVYRGCPCRDPLE